MATKRKPLGNAQRFKILQRDGFRCQYCGRTPPAVILHVDHVVAVAEGGGNEEANLLAACSDCNHGKHVKPLQAETIPRDYQAMALDARERAKQLSAYRKHLSALRQEVDGAIDDVGVCFWGKGLTWSAERSATQRAKVERFINLLGLDEVMNAARISLQRLPSDRAADGRFKYFCGVCWNRCTQLGIRGDDDAR